nr:hypothetical protein CFP56_49765 [Quercus suber]
MIDQNLSGLGPHRSVGEFRSGRFFTGEQNLMESYGDDDEYRSPEKRKESKSSRLGNSTGDEEDEGGEEEVEIRVVIGEVRGVAGISERQ